MYLCLYSLLRFGLEFLRGDTERGMWWGNTLSTSQIICIFSFAGGLWLWRARKMRGIQQAPQPAEAAPPPTAQHKTHKAGAARAKHAK